MALSIDKKRVGLLAKRAFYGAVVAGGVYLFYDLVEPIIADRTAFNELVKKSKVELEQAKDRARQAEALKRQAEVVSQNETRLFNEAKEFTDQLGSISVGQTEYSILGRDTMRVTEGDISYRFNFAVKIISIRFTTDDTARTDNISTMSFNQYANPAYLAELKSRGCKIARSDAPIEFKKADISKYSADWQVYIKAVYADIRTFGELHCGGLS